MKLTYSPQKGTPGHCMVAQVWADGLNAAEIVPTADPEEATAMARMFASSPDLLAACEAIQAAMSKYGAQLSNLFGHDEQVNDAVDAVDTAIAKAKGLMPTL